jgi:hypothetical protein
MEQGQSWRRYKKRVVGNYLREEDKGRFPVRQCEVVDPGTDTTFEALEKRGYILCRYELVAGLGDPLVYIQITPAGASLCVLQQANSARSRYHLAHSENSTEKQT